MSEYLHWLVQSLDPFYVIGALYHTFNLSNSTKVLFWILVLMILRYQIPDIAIWVA